MSTFEIVMAIINVVAIITIPIAAVFVGQKLQDRNQKRKDKMAIFQCLMTHRATGWAHQDTVNALNTIDIIFVDDESVRKCWADLFSKYKPNYSTQEITTALGYEKKITWETIQNPYLPDGLVQRMEKTAKFEQGQLAMAEFMTNMAGNPAPLGNAMLKQAAKQVHWKRNPTTCRLCLGGTFLSVKRLNYKQR